MKTIKLIVKTGTQKYPIFIGSNLISKISKIMNDNSIEFKKCLLIIDRNVQKKLVVQLGRLLNLIEFI